jgi:alanyl-tRNA synthetase
LEKELGELRAAGVADAVRRAANDAIEINGFKLVRAIVQAKDAAELRRAADVARAAVGTGVGVLAAPMGQHATLLVFVTEDLTKTRRLKAGDLIKAIGPIMAARGGGRPALAQAGGGNPALIDRAFAEAERILREQMR